VLSDLADSVISVQSSVDALTLAELSREVTNAVMELPPVAQ